MNQFITLQNHFFALQREENKADELYLLIDQLDHCTEPEKARRLQVDCYMQLHRYVKAEEIFLQVYNKDDKKDIKKLHTIRELMGQGIPVIGRKQKGHAAQTCTLPTYLYHLDPVKTGVFQASDHVCCSVCKQSVPYYYTGPFYTMMDYEFICPWCIADGSAADQLQEEMHKDQYASVVGELFQCITCHAYMLHIEYD